MTEEDKPFCEQNRILTSEEYKGFSKAVIDSEAMASSEIYPNLVMRLLHEDLIAEVSATARETLGFLEARAEITKVLKEEHGIDYSEKECITEILAIDTEVCLAAALTGDAHEVFDILPPKPAPDDTAKHKNPTIIVASRVDPIHQEDTGTACDAIKESLTTGIVQDPMDKKTDTPSHGLTYEVQCQETPDPLER